MSLEVSQKRLCWKVVRYSHETVDFDRMMACVARILLPEGPVLSDAYRSS